MENIKLDLRLGAVASFVKKGERVADVGTDHGYIPIWLRARGISPRVIASDINKQPLDTARENAARYGIDGISFSLCDGLYGIDSDSVDTVIIAGMGGETIAKIIECSGWEWTGKHLLLQPMSKHAELVEWLYDNGFSVCGEAFAEERNDIYRILYVLPVPAEKPRKAYIWCGFTDGKYRMLQTGKLLRALNGLSAAKTPDREREKEYRDILEDIENAYGK